MLPRDNTLRGRIRNQSWEQACRPKSRLKNKPQSATNLITSRMRMPGVKPGSQAWGACMIHTCSNESCVVVWEGRKKDKDTEGEIGQTILESQFVKFSSTHQWTANACQETRRVVTYECHPVSHQLDNFKHAHAGGRNRVTSMAGLYDAATLHAL